MYKKNTAATSRGERICIRNVQLQKNITSGYLEMPENIEKDVPVFESAENDHGFGHARRRRAKVTLLLFSTKMVKRWYISEERKQTALLGNCLERVQKSTDASMHKLTTPDLASRTRPENENTRKLEKMETKR
jgi:hypothetical protein